MRKSLFILILAASSVTNAQQLVTLNTRLEFLSSISNCAGSPDQCPRWGTTIAPFSGNYYLGFHEFNYNNSGEAISARLSAPLVAGTAYTYTVMAAIAPITAWGGSATGDRNGVIYVYGGTSSCATTQLIDSITLYTPADRNKWRQFTFNFTATANHTHLSFMTRKVASGGFAAFSYMVLDDAIRFDFGDAPDTYKTLQTSDGASHQLVGNTESLLIGYTVDGEEDGFPGTSPIGDDNSRPVNDEDGFASLPDLSIYQSQYVLNNIPVKNVTGKTAFLAGWIDFNRNGVFEGAEAAVTTVSPSGMLNVSLNWSGFTISSVGTSYARFRISTDSNIVNPQASLCKPNGLASDGEVEDHKIDFSDCLPVSASPDVSICRGASAILSASGAETYTWSPSVGLSAVTGATVTANPSVTTTYTVTGRTGAGCTGTAAVTVTVNPALTATVSPDVSICSGDSTTLTAGGGTSYSWSPASGLSATSGPTVTANPAVTTTYTVTISDGNCPPATASVTVTILQNAVATVSPDVSICSGGSGTTLTAGGGDTYAWSPASGLSATTGASVTANPSATTTYTVSVSSGTCPPSTATVTVTVVQAPQASLSPDVSICAGAQTTLTASGGDTYAWSPPEGLSQTSGSTVTATPTVTTTYTVSAQRQGCTPSTASVTVTVISSDAPDAGPDVAICRGESVVLEGSGSGDLVWSPAAGLSCTACPGPVASPQITTIYTLTAAGGQCPAASDAVTVTVLEPPAASAGPSQTVPRGQRVTLRAEGGIAYRWLHDGSGGETVEVSPQDEAVFCVEVTGANGCSDTACASISVSEPIVSELWIPSSFTPNEDQNNALFQTPGINIIEYQAAIFNRWGELIHEWNDIEKGWDGTFRGMPVQDDVYAYRIRALGADGIRYNKTGMLLIIK
jgi:gliding motility-associated-like protein